jgi:N-hydroxyarylamine O-acetyltransferase
MAFEAAGYFARIGMATPPPTAEGLAQLQRAQLQAIAFENIDPFLGQVPRLGLEDLAEKLIERRRGGYCFELNSLFGQALRATGFRATPVLARVRLGRPEGGARTHLAFVVEIEGESWLADAGFGGTTPPLPLRVEPGLEQPIGSELYRLRHEPDSDETVAEKQTAEGWYSLYGFDRMPVRPADVEAANVVCARWEQSPFPFHLMMSRVTPEGGFGLFDTRLTRRKAGVETVRTIESKAELGRALGEDLQVELAPGLLDAVAARLNLA